MIEQVTSKWVSDYTKELLASFEGEGEGLEEHQHWCRWLEEKAPQLIEQFTKENRFPASASTIKKQWEQWMHDKMFHLVEEWEDYSS
jgi:hypothetical protein